MMENYVSQDRKFYTVKTKIYSPNDGELCSPRPRKFYTVKTPSELEPMTLVNSRALYQLSYRGTTIRLTQLALNIKCFYDVTAKTILPWICSSIAADIASAICTASEQ